MNKLWLMTRYYFGWQVIIKIVIGIGVLLFIAKVLAMNTSDNLTFVFGLGAFSFLLVIPFCSGSTALRGLIANAHTRLVPGFRLQAGIAHMLIAVAASVYLYVNFLIFSPQYYSPLVMLRTFYCFSAYACFMQLVLPSRYFVPIISFSPFVFVIVLLRFRELAAALFLDPGVTIALFLVSLAGWAYGLRVLATRNNFMPANTAMDNTLAWGSYDGGLLINRAIGDSRTAEGTLLLGYPDNWGGIVLRVAYFQLITPLFTTLAMYLVGITDEWDGPKLQSILQLFLVISLFSGIFCIFIYGELVARARLLWLRYGTDRLAQWQLVDYYCRRFLMFYYLCGGLVALAACLFTDISGIYLLHYLLIMFSYCCFNLYFSLFCRAYKLPALVLCLVVILCVASLVAGFISVFRDDAPPSYTLLIAFEIVVMMLGLACRRLVKQRFTGIDWKLITMTRSPGRMVLTQD